MNPHVMRRRRVHDMEDEKSPWRHKKRKQLTEYLLKRSAKKGRTLQEQTATKICAESSFYDVITLPSDLLFKIFILVPAESLCKLQFVCKKWFDLINSSDFIEFHKQQSETVLVSQELYLDIIPPALFNPLQSLPHFHYVDFDCGGDNFVKSVVVDLEKVRASSDGLVLGLTHKKKSLILVNPLTRKHTKLSLGTVGFKESYSLAFCSEARTYKVVHLFRESSGYTGCEILSISTRKWSIIDGPSSELLEDIELMPVSVGGSLYWLPRRHGCDYFLSMDLQDEKFTTKKLPIACTFNDRLVEIGGALGFVTHVTLNLIQVWILSTKNAGGKECWIKHQSIYLSFDARLVIPICSSRNGKEIVFEYPGKDLYVYNFERGDMKKRYSRDDELINDRLGAEKLFIPHRNTLISWD